MKIINFGSLNIDHVYQVEHFVQPGETLASLGYQMHCGGKGLNQSIALARAGANVFHAGKIGRGGEHLLTKLSDAGVDTSLITTGEAPTGHAIIQVGANRTITSSDVDRVLSSISDNDWLLLQNEINDISLILEATRNRRYSVVFNPAPMTPDIQHLPLELVDILVINEVEGVNLTNEQQPSAILDSLLNKYPAMKIILTSGKFGATYVDKNQRIHQEGFKVEAVDTTAAGDTFIGFFIASLSSGLQVNEALRIGCRASSICVTRPGAADSIPFIDEVYK
ncbi:MAG: ribokinase [Candidatus Thorarchaeota archaeon]